MNKKEVLEIRKQFTPENCTITRICGCYVDHEKEKKMEMKKAFLSMPEEEAFKYFDIFRHTLSGTVGKNLMTMEFPLDQELEAGQTMALAPGENTALLNEAAARLRAAGYAPCVYCSASWAKGRLVTQELDCPLWLAYYYADPNDPDFDSCEAIGNVDTAWGKYTCSLGRKLCGWQFGRIGYGAVYGVGSVNVDRDWIYFQPGEREEEPPVFVSGTLKIGPVSTGDRASIRTLAESLCIPAADEGDYLIVGPMSADGRAAVSNKALALGLGCEDCAAPEEGGNDKTPKPPAADLPAVMAALERIEKAQTAQGGQLAALAGKLSAAAGVLAG